MIKTHSDISSLLNNLVEMQVSPAYAVRKRVLVDAEQSLLFLDLANAKLQTELATLKQELYILQEQEPVAWQLPDNTIELCQPSNYSFEVCTANGCLPLYAAPKKTT